MVNQLLYLIGQPGAGKSTLFSKLGLPKGRALKTPFLHTVYPSGLIQLGGLRETFSGTDTLPMDVQPKVIQWLKLSADDARVIAEGDRLANDLFFRAARSYGWELTAVYLCTPDNVAAQRRAERGSTQNLSWIKGRSTKVANLAKFWCSPQWTLDGGLPVERLAKQLLQHPIFKVQP